MPFPFCRMDQLPCHIRAFPAKCRQKLHQNFLTTPLSQDRLQIVCRRFCSPRSIDILHHDDDLAINSLGEGSGSFQGISVQNWKHERKIHSRKQSLFRFLLLHLYLQEISSRPFRIFLKRSNGSGVRRDGTASMKRYTALKMT